MKNTLLSAITVFFILISTVAQAKPEVEESYLCSDYNRETYTCNVQRIFDNNKLVKLSSLPDMRLWYYTRVKSEEKVVLLHFWVRQGEEDTINTQLQQDPTITYYDVDKRKNINISRIPDYARNIILAIIKADPEELIEEIAIVAKEIFPSPGYQTQSLYRFAPSDVGNWEIRVYDDKQNILHIGAFRLGN